ncbi:MULTISPECIES: hypothetical protein [Cysteiniphilum]|uniref:Uncharacterized protein n=1 Tax=Cysteiniphilum litorale TaxID=2056700 RepID=A0A8J2Z7A3_9GAMM|nr:MULTISPECIES: hypothetical protein [Cysteiniphilum]GGG08876.1 hypothetical protein GCM10010995_28060 [Cysteiniphilum litorale]
MASQYTNNLSNEIMESKYHLPLINEGLCLNEEREQIEDLYFKRSIIRHKYDDWMFLFKSVLVIYFLIKVILLLKVDDGINLHITLSTLNALTLSNLFVILLALYASLHLVKRMIIAIGIKKIDRNINQVKNRVGDTLVDQWIHGLDVANIATFKRVSNHNL